METQRAKKVVSDSPRLVDFFDFDGQVMFFEKVE